MKKNNSMEATCKMSGTPTTWPCSAAGCPLFGDCLTEYQRSSKHKDTLNACLKGVHRKADCKNCDIRSTCPFYTAPPEPAVPLMTNEKRLLSFNKEELATTIHAFHLGYAPWCDHHCKMQGEDGCDKCILNWLGMPATCSMEVTRI